MTSHSPLPRRKAMKLRYRQIVRSSSRPRSSSGSSYRSSSSRPPLATNTAELDSWDLSSNRSSTSSYSENECQQVEMLDRSWKLEGIALFDTGHETCDT